MSLYSSVYTNGVCFKLFILLILLANSVFCGNIVKYLPGFDGELPFTLETGYITVEDSELFYYFIESEGNPRKDPLLLWYSGGPGCSAFNGLIYEIGPLAFNITGYEGGLPALEYHPYSWTKMSSILFVDAPVGTGFSYPTSTSAYPTSDTKSAAQTYEFLRKWFGNHTQFLKVPLFIGADSYSGISAAIVVQNVLEGNKNGLIPHMNLKGYTFGCPRTDAYINENSVVPYSHRLALISDELFESANTSCGGDFVNVNATTQPECYENLKLVTKCTKDINKNNILEPKCTWASPQPEEESERRSLEENVADLILPPPRTSDFWCHNLNYSLSYVWANDKCVQSALYVRNGTVLDWKRCNKKLDYTMDVDSVLSYHRNFSTLGLQVLIYNGDHDLIVPNIGTEEWIMKLDLPVVNNWRPWLVDGQTAGYTIKYSNHGYRLTYATVLGAGHSPQEYKRRECFEMFRRWIHYYPL